MREGRKWMEKVIHPLVVVENKLRNYEKRETITSSIISVHIVHAF